MYVCVDDDVIEKMGRKRRNTLMVIIKATIKEKNDKEDSDKTANFFGKNETLKDQHHKQSWKINNVLFLIVLFDL